MNPSPEKFQKNITEELKVLQDRVRHLIGGAHWVEEGRHKEAVLRSVIKRFLPTNVSLGTGFIIKKENDEIKISKQIDIIIYDNTYPVLFAEDDFIITTPANVKGIIEVKTKLNSSRVDEVVTTATKNGSLVSQEIFNGIFVYEKGKIKIDKQKINDNIKVALRASKGTVNHICLGKDIFIKFWRNRNTQNNYSDEYYSIYKIERLSFSYFISNLVEHLSRNRLKERWWFLYPIKKGKEEYKIEDIHV